MIVALLLLASLPVGISTIDRVDIVEINHFFDGQGQPVFNQVIWYEWTGLSFDVVAWRVIRSDEILPIKRNGVWVSRWIDKGTEREVRAKSYRESWTQHDPELIEREHLPKEKRRGLRR